MENVKEIIKNLDNFKLDDVLYIPTNLIKNTFKLKPNKFIKHDKRCEGAKIGIILPDKYIDIKETFDKNPHVKALKQRFIEKLEWEQTEYKKLYKTWYIKMFKGIYANNSWDDLKKHKLEQWDNIYIDIKTNGYKEHKEKEHNIEVCINKNGEPLFIDGRHRLFFAQILNIPEIPVIVNIWSENFVKKFNLL